MAKKTKDLFRKKYPSRASMYASKNLLSSSSDSVGREVESALYTEQFIKDRDRYKPNIDFTDPSNFVRFGSAKEYYEKSIENIYKTYPYDGSLKEKLEWHNSSSYFDNYFFEYEYPRTNGYISIGQNWTADSTTAEDAVDKIVAASSPQYISIQGGPHGPQAPAYDPNYDKALTYKRPEHKANIFDSEINQKQNLTIDGTTGNTVEFWLKLPTNSPTGQDSPSYAYFDLWNESTDKTSSGEYGRLLVETRLDKTLDGTYTDDSLFHITYMSGNSGAERSPIGPTSLLTSQNITLTDWNHYAFVAKNNPTGSNHLLFDLYINGYQVDTVHTGSQISEVRTGPFNANIGAYRYNPASNLAVANGEGSISGSFFDEFRFWKKSRNQKDIALYWFTQIGGGTNTDYGLKNSKYTGSLNPVDLGVYYKFNEGIVGSGLDSTVLDYSGRVSNGTYNNYSFTSTMPELRFTSSAMVESNASDREFKDPILYSIHPTVADLKTEITAKGIEYDSKNSMSLYNMMPMWILDDDEEKDKKTVKKLTQIMASYFDELFIQTERLNKLKDETYISGSVSGSIYKPLPFADKLLHSRGFMTTELFANASVLESLANRDETKEFKSELVNVKNQIYTNIYNNLNFITKAKGTEKSIRNLLRCYGIDDNIYALSFYANNSDITLNQSITPKIIRKNYVNFATASNQGALVYQSTASSNANSVMYITGSTNAASGFDNDLGFTLEAEVIFPRELAIDNPKKGETEYTPISASLFGMHSVPLVQSNEADTTWSTTDYASLQVYAVRERNSGIYPSNNEDQIKFVLTGTNVNASTEASIPFLTSSVYSDVYEGEKWNFAVKVYPTKYPNLGAVSGTSGHTVEFQGINTQADTVINHFVLTGSVSNGTNVLSDKKRVYIGSHRTNYTGSLIVGTNVRMSSCRYWAIPLETQELISHAIDATNYGVFNPAQSAYLFQEYGVNIPKIRTLALHWDFNQNTGSDSGGAFAVEDFSYGTTDAITRGDLSTLLSRQHTGRGLYFGPSRTDAIKKERVYTYKQQVPENLDIADTVKIINKDQEFFTPRTRPITFSFAAEKSMYQNISEEMLNFMAYSAESSGLENLVGDPINKYRPEYKLMQKIRNIFFERISNTADLDKYLDFYKWLDGSVSFMISQLVPASSEIEGVRNIVESHILERNKIQHRFPTFEFGSNDPAGSINGINELLYNWEFGHAPTFPSPGVAATTTITATATPTAGKQITLRQLLAGGSTNSVTFTVHNTTTSGNNFAKTGADHGLTNLKTLIDAAGIYTTSAVQNLGGGSYRLTITQNLKGALGNTTVTSNVDNYTVAGAASAAADGVFSDGIDRKYQEDSCNWWNKKVNRQDPILATGISDVDVGRATIHSASLQVFNRRFSSPYKITAREGNGALKTKYNKRSIVMTETEPFANTKTITYNTTTFTTSSVICLDDVKINPNLKRQADYQVQLSDTTNTKSKYSSGLVAPYTFFSSSAKAVATGVPTGFQAGPDHLRDYYLDTKEIPAQGPFTRQHVGGNQYRNLGFAYKPAQLNRPTDPRKDVFPQAWYSLATFGGGNFYYTIVNPSYFNSTFTRADYTRDFIAKSPVNIKNIKTVNTTFSSSYGSMLSLGNYAHNYEVVQTADRSVNNRYLAENKILNTSSVASPYIRDLNDFALPDRGRHSAIMVNRFSAPGGPEVNGRGFLDVESETFSVYNAIPFRNLTVRQPLNTWLTKHSAFGGYDSEYGAPSASFHKTQRNGAKRILSSSAGPRANNSGFSTGSEYDNYWVQHMIPRSDMGYAWITASATNVIFGYEQPNVANASMASTDLSFIGASQHQSFLSTFGLPAVYRWFGSAKTEGVRTDFVGLNSHIIGDITSSTNTLGFSLNADFVNGGLLPETDANIKTGLAGASAVLNGINLNRNGAGGFSSWKQVRQSYHPIVRYHNKRNVISLVTSSVVLYNDEGIAKVKPDTISFTLSPVTFAHKPLKHHFTLKSTGEDLFVDSTYANNLQTFSYKRINDIIGFEAKDGDEVYDNLKRIYIDKYLGATSPIGDFVNLKYSETVYPRKNFTGLAKSRGRENYTGTPGSEDYNKALGSSLTFWKGNIDNRLRTDNEAKTMGDVVIHSASAPFGLIDLSNWPLDAEEPFLDYLLVSASAGAGDDDFDPYFWSPLGPSGAFLRPDLEPRWNNVDKNGELSHAGWLLSLYDINADGKYNLDGLGARGPLTNLRFYGTRATASIQYEYPNLVWSGSFPYGPRPKDGNTGGSGVGDAHMINQSSASLHLIPPFRTDVLSGRRPWFDSYEDYANDIRYMAKEHTIIPEFRISEHMDYYIDNGFKADNNKFMTLVGASLNNTGSATSETGAFQQQFFNIYSNTDFLSKIVDLKTDHKKGNVGLPTEISLKVKAVKKLLPYQGFYPALRAVQLGQLFSASYGPYITGSNNYAAENENHQGRLAALYQPFFAPGIFFNTIKSGIAVDYSVHTGSIPAGLEAIYTRWGRNPTAEIDLGVDSPYSASNMAMSLFTEAPNFSFPFEAILNPDRYFPATGSNDTLTKGDVEQEGIGFRNADIFFAYPHFTGSLSHDANVTYADPWSATSTSPTTGTRQDFFFSWQGQSDVRYSLAANNFFAEVENFFLESRSPTSFVSKPAKDFKPMVSGSVYIMDVVLSKTENFVSYEGPSGSFQFNPFTGSASTSDEVTKVDPTNALGRARCFDKSPYVSARGMHYGPPYLAQPYIFGNPESGSAFFEDPCYAIHTPPYFYGDAVARIEVRPHEIYDLTPDQSIKIEFDEMIANAQILTKYFNSNQRAKDLQNPSFRKLFPAGTNQMQISSSVDLFGRVQLKNAQYSNQKDADGNFIPDGSSTPGEASDQMAWVIESKFECPSINLADMDVDSLGAGIGLGREKYYTRGIWKGYGQPTSGSDGIFLQIRESDPMNVFSKVGAKMHPTNGSPLTGSLIDVCGFETRKSRIGEIASTRTISEAIVAMPIDKNGDFYEIDAGVFLQHILNINAGDPDVKVGQFGSEADIATTSIGNMIRKMKKYYIPPQLDAINNGSVSPKVMYIFEFNHNLNKGDLSNIWQNVMPDIATTAELDEAVIKHRLDSQFEFFGSLPKPDNAALTNASVNPFINEDLDIRWMVFKVKQRGKNNYNNVTKKSETSLGFSFTNEEELASFTSSPNKELKYSYNWPYDFFSLVELAQVDSEVTFEKSDIPTSQQAGQVSQNLNAAQGTIGGPNPPTVVIEDPELDPDAAI